MKKELSAGLISQMRESGAFRTENFSLQPDFAGVYNVKGVRPYKSGSAEENNAFNVECTSENGLATISGFAFSNARVLKDENLGAEPIKDKVYDAEKIKDALANAIFMNSKFEEGKTFKFPDQIKIIGASVNTDEDGNPLLPMRRYRGYQQCLNHHRNLLDDDTAFMSREEFATYLASSGEQRPVGLPEGLNELTLPSGVEADDMKTWSYTLLLADIADA